MNVGADKVTDQDNRALSIPDFSGKFALVPDFVSFIDNFGKQAVALRYLLGSMTFFQSQIQLGLG